MFGLNFLHQSFNNVQWSSNDPKGQVPQNTQNLGIEPENKRRRREILGRDRTISWTTWGHSAQAPREVRSAQQARNLTDFTTALEVEALAPAREITLECLNALGL